MKITFVDTIAFNYSSVDHPLNFPMGAGNSAICYVAKELSANGHEVTIFNGCRQPGESHGVKIRNLSELLTGAPGNLAINKQDIAVVCSGAIGEQLRRSFVQIPMVMWTQHAHDQPGINPLINKTERDAWNGIVYVSEWQRAHYEHVFGLKGFTYAVLPNGVAPAFEKVKPDAPWYQAERPPRLVYTSTPFRGLMELLSAFPAIRKATGAQLRVYSSMKTYQKTEEEDDFTCLYRYCDSLDGAAYVGSLGQEQLAEELSWADALVYPSTFAEGLCVSMLEAMSLGLAIFTTNLGALPEVAREHAKYCERMGYGLSGRFADLVIEGLRNLKRDPDKAMRERAARIDYTRERFTWNNIAVGWERWLTELTRQSGPIARLKTGS